MTQKGVEEEGPFGGVAATFSVRIFITGAVASVSVVAEAATFETNGEGPDVVVGDGVDADPAGALLDPPTAL
jgi:hypothetical protein